MGSLAGKGNPWGRGFRSSKYLAPLKTPDSNLLDNPTDFDLKSVIKRAFQTFSTDRLNFFNVTSLATSSRPFARFANVSRASALTLGRSEFKNVWDFSPEARRGGGGGYSWEFFVGVCLPVLQILTRFQTKKCNSTPVFRLDI